MQGIKDTPFLLKEFWTRFWNYSSFLCCDSSPSAVSPNGSNSRVQKMCNSLNKKVTFLLWAQWVSSGHSYKCMLCWKLCWNHYGLNSDCVTFVFLFWNFLVFKNLNQLKINPADSRTQQPKDKTVTQKLFGWKVI